MMARRSAPVAALALLLVFGGLAGCNEDTIYDEGGSIEEDTSPTPVTSNPGLADVGTAAPLATTTNDTGIGDGEDRTGN